MIKVLNLTTHLNSGGITIYILRLCRIMQKHGIQYYIASSGGDYSRKFREAGCNTLKVDIKTKNELHPKLFFALPKLIRYIKRENIQIVHAHTRVTQVLAFWLRKFTDVKVVTTCHGFYRLKLGRKLLPAWGDMCIAISQPVADTLQNQYKLKKTLLRVVHNAIDIEEWDQKSANWQKDQAKQSFGFESSDRVIGIIARIEKVKGQEELLRSFKELSPQFPNAKVLIVGEGKYRSHLEAFCQESQIWDKVLFTGQVDDVSWALCATDLFAFPATWKEAFGFSLIEAMVCRLPVITTENWALADLAKEYQSACLIPTGDIPALRQALQSWLQNPQIFDKTAQNGRRMAEDLFTLPKMATALTNAYNHTLTA